MDEPTINFTINDIAYILGVTRATVYNWQNSGALPAGSGIDVIKAAITNDERKLADIRKRLSERATEKLVSSV